MLAFVAGLSHKAIGPAFQPCVAPWGEPNSKSRYEVAGTLDRRGMTCGRTWLVRTLQRLYGPSEGAIRRAGRVGNSTRLHARKKNILSPNLDKSVFEASKPKDPVKIKAKPPFLNALWNRHAA